MKKSSSSVVNRDEISRIVDIFYQHEFKTFYINSVDGKTFVKPIGIFVSLGLTTSMQTLENIKNVLEENGFIVKLAEIKSKRVNNMFLNTLTKEDNPQQYRITSNCSNNVFDEESARTELQRLESLLTVNQKVDVLAKTATKVSSLRKLIEKLSLTNGWSDHNIQMNEDNEYCIFHKNVNYKKEDDLEYRIGIYVVGKE